MTLSDRLMAKVDRTDGGCWLWTARLDRDGYGIIQAHGNARFAHRIAYELFVGEIPDGLQVDHVCHRADECAGGKGCLHRRCVNPEHLEAITPRANVLRSHNVTARNAAAIECIHGHPFDEANTYVYPSGPREGERKCRSCARDEARRRRAAA